MEHRTWIFCHPVISAARQFVILSGQVRSGQVRSGQVRSGQVRQTDHRFVTDNLVAEDTVCVRCPYALSVRAVHLGPGLPPQLQHPYIIRQMIPHWKSEICIMIVDQ